MAANSGSKAPTMSVSSAQSKTRNLFLLGLVTTSVPAIVCALVAHYLDLYLYVGIAVGIQLCVFFLHALPNQSEKFYDLSGAITNLTVVLTALLHQQKLPKSPRQLLVAVASIIWLTRLGTFLYGRILKDDGKDERFKDLKTVFTSWLGCWMFQALWVTLIQLPVILVNSLPDDAPRGSGWSSSNFIDIIAGAIWILGFAFEVAADTEKSAFRSIAANRHRFITTGTWRYSRHPNYFGEITMWLALGLACANMGWSTSAQATSANSVGLTFFTKMQCGWISGLFTMLLLVKVSGVPMVEKLGRKKWGKDPAYIHYMKNTSCVIPWFPAKAGPPQQQTSDKNEPE